uniref:uncharacterized protein LOC120326393 isoform X2 n=1 Tax=Styela clava TaxID=7725 RepID=UPI00193A3815|nr:uncharacterized protein LOC120326393 isoform X2 [Styela clava]
MDVQIQSIEPDYGGIKVVWKKNAKIEPIYKIRAYSGVDLVGEYKVHGCQFLYHPEDPLKKYFFKIWPDSETVDSENLERNSTKECSLCYHVGNDVYVDYTRKLNPHYDIFGGFECESTIRRDVAVKIFDIREPDKQSQKDLKLEMGNLRDVDHENIISSKDGIFCSIEGIWGFFSRQYPDLIRIVFELMRDKLNQVPDARIYPLSDIDLPSVEKMIYEETDSIELKNTTMNFGYDSFYSEALVHVSEHIPDPDENVFPIGPMLNCSMEQNLREEVQITMKTVCQNTENGAVKLFHVVGGQPIKKSNLLPKKNCVSCSLKKFEQLYLGIEKSAIQHVHFKVVAALYYNNFCEMILNFHIQNDCRYHSVMHAGFRCAVEFNAFSVKIGQNLRLQLFCDSHSNLNEQFVEFELDESHLDRSAHSKKVELKYFQSDLPTGPVVAEILVDDKKVESQNFNISSFPLSEIFLFQ